MQPLFWYAVAAVGLSLILHSASIFVKPLLQAVLSYVSIPLFAIAAVLVLSLDADLLAWLFTLLSYSFIVNAARIIQRRMHAAYLRQAVRRTTFILTPVYAGIFGLWCMFMAGRWSITTNTVVTGLLLLSVITALVLLGTTVTRLVANRRTLKAVTLPDKELPSITIAIPARNETLALTQTLQAVLASDYPKLEILVLDDCSQDKTAEIIRGFAQDGVRFIEGQPTPQDGHWLSKNYAFEQLAKAAAGEYILFSSVDVLFEPNSIRRLVSLAIAEKRTMLSVMPARRLAPAGAFVIQPLQNWWQVTLPKELLGRVPAVSSVWLVQRKKLEQAGGIAAVSRAINPESYFARLFNKQKAYRFVMANEAYGVHATKSLKDQYQTALRLRYPAARRRPERVFGWELFAVLMLGIPFASLIYAWQQPLTLVWWLAVIAVLLLVTNYTLTVAVTQRKATILAPVSFLTSLAVEVVLLNWSMLAYEFGTIEWKGRNVCLPVMHVVPHLPELPDTRRTIR